MWVLLVTVILTAISASQSLESQFRTTEQTNYLDENLENCVQADLLEFSVELCTVDQSCEETIEMPWLTNEQKKNVKALYKLGKQIVHCESSILFLNTSLEENFIPKSFKIQKFLPGNQKVNQERFDKVSLEAIRDEKERHLNILKGAKDNFEKTVKQTTEVLGKERATEELKQVNKHLDRIRKTKADKRAKKWRGIKKTV